MWYLGIVLNTLLDSDQTVGVRTGFQVPCEDILFTSEDPHIAHAQNRLDLFFKHYK
jgi:hypothetical protein